MGSGFFWKTRRFEVVWEFGPGGWYIYGVAGQLEFGKAERRRGFPKWDSPWRNPADIDARVSLNGKKLGGGGVFR